MNKERMARIIKDIEKFFKELDDRNIKNIETLKNSEKFYAVSMLLFSIINRAIDLGEEIVSAKKLGFPSHYKEIFRLLYDGKIIDSKLRKTLEDLAHSRNLLAHEYQTFTRKDVFRIFKKINAVKKFVAIVKKVVK